MGHKTDLYCDKIRPLNDIFAVAMIVNIYRHSRCETIFNSKNDIFKMFEQENSNYRRSATSVEPWESPTLYVYSINPLLSVGSSCLRNIPFLVLVIVSSISLTLSVFDVT